MHDDGDEVVEVTARLLDIEGEYVLEVGAGNDQPRGVEDGGEGKRDEYSRC